jgi:hypothetical protein
VRLEGLGQLKNPVTSSGIEPAIFRLVAIGCRIRENLTEKGWVIINEVDCSNKFTYYFQ